MNRRTSDRTSRFFTAAAVGTLVALAATPALARDDAIPDGFRGFSGTLEGVVVAKDATSFRLLVRDVVNTWEKNTATDPESIVGKRVVIHARWREGDDGRVYANERDVAFIRTLRARERVRIEVKYDEETKRIHILELDEDQRERAGVREGDGKDGKRREEEKKREERRKEEEKKRDEKKRDGEKRDGEKRDGEKKDGERDGGRRR